MRGKEALGDLLASEFSNQLQVNSHLPSDSERKQGHYVVATPFDSRSVMLFDFAAQRWDEIAKISMGFPNWSKTGDYVYFLDELGEPSVMRVRIRDRMLERVVDLKNFRQAGYYGYWLGLAPDDSPLLLRDTGTQEIYALGSPPRPIRHESELLQTGVP